MEVQHTEAAACAAPTEGSPLRSLFPELCVPRQERGAALLHEALVLGVAILFSRTHLAFGMYPFALAYLAARRWRAVPALLGAVLGGFSLGAGGAVFATAALFTFLLRLAFSYSRRDALGNRALFTEPTALRVLAAALGGAGLAAYELLISGTAEHVLYFAATAILTPTLLTALLSPIYDTPVTARDVLGRREPLRHPYGEVRPAVAECSALSLLLAVGLALRPLSLFGLSLSTLFSVAVTLLVGRRLLAPRAAVVGLCLGLLSALYSGVSLALLGLLSGFLFPYGALYGVLGGVSAAVAAASYLGGLSGFLSTAPEGAVAALLAFPLLARATAEEDPAERELSRRAVCEAVSAGAAVGEEGTARLARLGEAFSELSGMFYRLSDGEKRPATAEYLGECQRVCARYCATCSNRVRCWEQGERVAERAVYALAERLRETGRIGEGDLPADLRSGCPKMVEILEEIRDQCASMAVKHYRGDRNECLSHDYASLSRLLLDAAEADRAEEQEDREATARWREALGEEGAGLALSVYGTRRRRLAVGAIPPTVLEGRETLLRERAESALGCRLSAPEEIAVRDKKALRMTTARRYRVETAEAAVPLSGGAPSGDTLAFLTAKDDYFYALLSDGIGSGERAAAGSGVCVDFLRAMLAAGCGRKATLRMLNDLVRMRGEEGAATVDMLIFDLLYGHATFIKSGAAPSYIKRGREILRVRSRTMPLGIAKTVDAERINVTVKEGDVLILLSDGLVPDGEDPAWLLSLLSEESADDLNALCRRIMAEAVSKEPPPADDMTVAAVRIECAPLAQ